MAAQYNPGQLTNPSLLDSSMNAVGYIFKYHGPHLQTGVTEGHLTPGFSFLLTPPETVIADGSVSYLASFLHPAGPLPQVHLFCIYVTYMFVFCVLWAILYIKGNPFYLKFILNIYVIIMFALPFFYYLLVLYVLYVRIVFMDNFESAYFLSYIFKKRSTYFRYFLFVFFV